MGHAAARRQATPLVGPVARTLVFVIGVLPRLAASSPRNRRPTGGLRRTRINTSFHGRYKNSIDTASTL